MHFHVDVAFRFAWKLRVFYPSLFFRSELRIPAKNAHCKHLSLLPADKKTPRSKEEAAAWKQKECERTAAERSAELRSECRSNGTIPVCIRQGTCIRDICKFCYTWECGEEWENSTSVSQRSTPSAGEIEDETLGMLLNDRLRWRFARNL